MALSQAFMLSAARGEYRSRFWSFLIEATLAFLGAAVGAAGLPSVADEIERATWALARAVWANAIRIDADYPHPPPRLAQPQLSHGLLEQIRPHAETGEKRTWLSRHVVVGRGKGWAIAIEMNFCKN